MLKKTMTYNDFDGNPVTEDFYFNLTKAELLELQVGTKGGFNEHLQKIVDSNDPGVIVEEFKKIILMAYGKKSDDGKRFIKSDQLRDEFTQTEAYSDLFIELATNDRSASDFINAIVPQGLVNEMEKISQKADAERGQTVQGEVVEQETPKPKDPKDMTREELLEAMRERNKAVGISAGSGS